MLLSSNRINYLNIFNQQSFSNIFKLIERSNIHSIPPSKLLKRKIHQLSSNV